MKMRTTLLPLSLFTLTLGLGGCALDESEGPVSCASGFGARECASAVIDLTARAHLGTIELNDDENNPSAYKFTVNEGVDGRYGAVFVTNGTGEDLRIKLELTRYDGMADPIGFTDRDGEPCTDPNNLTTCDRRWIDFDERDSSVRVIVREPNDDGGWNDVSLGEHSLHGADAEAASALPGNVVELNCSGVRLHDGDDDGHFRQYVSLLSVDEETGTGKIVVSNTSAPSTGTGPTICMWTGTHSEVGSQNCPDWRSLDKWRWIGLGQVAPGASTSVYIDPSQHHGMLFLPIYDDEVCPDLSTQEARDAARLDLSPSGRMFLRIADTTNNRVTFNDLVSCDIAHVPVAVPFTATGLEDAAGENADFEFVNCGDHEITVCNSSYGPCDPAAEGSGSFSVPADGSVVTMSYHAGFIHDLSWVDSDDPTVILRKRTKSGGG